MNMTVRPFLPELETQWELPHPLDGFCRHFRKEEIISIAENAQSIMLIFTLPCQAYDRASTWPGKWRLLNR
jgi:hypothetical protein